MTDEQAERLIRALEKIATLPEKPQSQPGQQGPQFPWAADPFPLLAFG